MGETADRMAGGRPSRPGRGADGAPGTDLSAEWYMPFIPGDQGHQPPPGADERALRGDVPPYIPVVGRLLMAFAALLVVGALTAGAVSNFDFHKRGALEPQSFTVSGAPTIVIRNHVGDVPVTASRGSAGRVTVEGTREARDWTPGWAQRNLERMTVPIAQSGDTITINAGPQGAGAGIHDVRHSVELRITVPPGTNLDVQQRVGSLRVSGVTGAVIREGRVGGVRLEDTTLTGASRLQTGAGEVRVEGALAVDASLDVEVGAGDVRLLLPATTNARLDATTTVGEIDADGFGIAARPNRNEVGATASGSFGAGPGGTLTVRVRTGDIDISPRAGGAPPPPPPPPPPPSR